jgi:hypothetical protein
MSGLRRLRNRTRGNDKGSVDPHLIEVMAWETQAIRRRGPSPENPHPVTAIFGR